MANKKFTELTDLPSPAGADILAIVDDVAGTPTTKKVTATNLMGLAPVQSVAGQTGTVTLDADDIDDASTTNKSVTASDVTNLSNLSGTNTGDQDLSSYQLQPSEGAFANGDKTKLDGIEASADVTDTVNVTAAGALMDSEVTNLAQVKAFDSSDYATAAQGTLADSATQPGDLGTSAALDVGTSANNVVQLNGSAQLPAVDGSNLTGISTAVEGTAVLSTGETGGTKFLREDGDGTCSFQEPSVDVDTPLNTALRGTDNPHIGVYPNQSLRVIDNPSKSVAVISDTNGNLDFVVKTDASRAYLNTPSGRLELTTGVSVVEDSTEPDIEITTTSGTYSLISGDSDTLGANGLPLQQGFNHPDIGANVAPLLISGGTIA